MFPTHKKGTCDDGKINSRPIPTVTAWYGTEPLLDPRQRVMARALVGHRDELERLLAIARDDRLHGGH